MDVIEKFLNEVSWKFDKGYPDITNEQDMKMLNELAKGYIGEQEVTEKSLKQQIVDILKDGEFTDEQLVRLRNQIGGFAYEDNYEEYINLKGISSKASKAIFDKGIQMGEMDAIIKYINSDKPNFPKSQEEGNILTVFNESGLSDDFLLWLYQYTIGATESVVGVGKMEEFLTFMYEDTETPASGDVGLIGGGEIEVKGNGAKIWGQKKGIKNSSRFQDGGESIQKYFGEIIDEPYIGVKGGVQALRDIFKINVDKAIDQKISKDIIHKVIINILNDFYDTSITQGQIKKYVTIDVINNPIKLNEAIFTAQLTGYALSEGWEYLWLGIPTLGKYKVFKIDGIPSAVDNGEIKIHSHLGINNVYRAKLG